MSDTPQRVPGRGRLGVGSLSSGAGALLIGSAYYAGAKLGFALTLAPVPVSTLWPPNAILLAGLILTSTRSWPLILATVFVAHLAVQFQSGVPAAMVLCWYVSNCAEALVGAGLLRRFDRAALRFGTFRSTLAFLGCACAASFISSFLDAAFVIANGWGDASYATVWRTRFFSNVLASLTLVPVIVTTADALTRTAGASPKRLAEAVAGVGALAGVCWVVFVAQRPGPGTSPALLYAPLPLLVTAAVRFGPWGAAVSLLICALVAIWGAAHGQGPFVTSSAAENALAIQMFLIVAWIPVMSLAAVIRERARADARSRGSEEQLAMAIDAAQLGRWEWDIVTERLFWSDITRRIYEVPLDVPVNADTFMALVHPDDLPLIDAATADALAGRGVDVEFRVRFPDGRVKWILSKGRLVRDAEGRAARIVGIKVDITARKTAESQIREQQRQLAQVSGVSLAGEFSGAIAHELNQPLAAMLANVSAAKRFLRHDPPNLDEVREIIDDIGEDNRRAAAIVARVRTLPNGVNGASTLLEVNDVVASVLDVARGDIISRGVSLTKDLGRHLPQVRGDAVQLQQVLLNLVINGCDAMDAIPPDARRLRVTTHDDGAGGVRVSVDDNGSGVPRDRVEHIFDAFVTTKPQRLGLGLAICRSIVTAHDGQLWVEAGAEGGAVFSFSLPAFAAARDGDGRASGDAQPVAGRE